MDGDLRLVLIDSVVWAAWGVATGFAVSRLPTRALDHDTWLTRLRAVERGGRCYDRLGVRHWKDRLPDAGSLFGGRSKRHLGGSSSGDLERFAAETRRAEIVHWLGLAAGPAFLLWNPAGLAAAMVGFALVANLPFIVVQRSNRGRIARVLARRSARGGDAAGPTAGDPDPDVAPGSPRRRWTRRAALASVLLLAASVGVVGVGYATRSHPRAVTVEESIVRYRSGSHPVGGRTASTPEPGVYLAAGEGTNHLSRPPTDGVDGETMPVTVSVLDDGCWRWRIDYSSAHWQDAVLCGGSQQLRQREQRSYQAWDWGVIEQASLTTSRCSPAIGVPLDGGPSDASVAQRCESSSSSSDAVSTIESTTAVVGVETVLVGGREASTVHQRRTQRVSGGQVGTITEDWWFEIETGLPVRSSRSYRLAVSSPIGTLDYREDGSWTLASLTPRR